MLLATADGLTLEGDIFLPPHPWAAAVVAHPHPLYGGDRHDFVVTTLCEALAGAGVAAVRFDFRGVSRSEGVHDEGQGERLDIVAALEAAAPFAGNGPLLLAGYSFGARVALDVVDPRLDAWFLVAPPLTAGSAEPLAGGDHRPKHLVVAEHDQFAPLTAVEARVAGWKATTLEVVAMADHFFGGQTAQLAVSARGFATAQRLD